MPDITVLLDDGVVGDAGSKTLVFEPRAPFYDGSTLVYPKAVYRRFTHGSSGTVQLRPGPWKVTGIQGRTAVSFDVGSSAASLKALIEANLNIPGDTPTTTLSQAVTAWMNENVNTEVTDTLMTELLGDPDSDAVAAVDARVAAGTAGFLTEAVASENYAPCWRPSVSYDSGALVLLPAPFNSPGTRNSAGTSRGTFDATEQGLWTKTGGASTWSDLGGKPAVIAAGADATAARTAISAASSAQGDKADAAVRSINGVTPNSSGVLSIATASAAALERNRICSRMTVLPPQGRQTAIETLVNALMTAGIWDQLDGFYLLAAHTEQAAKINWRGGPAQDLTAVNAPIFTTNSGYTGDGSTSYLDTGLAGTAAEHFAQNSAFMAVWTLTNVNNSNYHDISGAGNSWIDARSGSATMIGRACAGSTFGHAVADSLGMSAWTRSASAAFTTYKNGAVLQSDTTASTALNSANFYIARNQTSYSARKIAFAAFGGALSDAQQLAMYNAVRTYLIAVGAVTA